MLTERRRPLSLQRSNAAAFVFAVMLHAVLIAALWTSLQMRTDAIRPVYIDLQVLPVSLEAIDRLALPSVVKEKNQPQRTSLGAVVQRRVTPLPETAPEPVTKVDAELEFSRQLALQRARELSTASRLLHLQNRSEAAQKEAMRRTEGAVAPERAGVAVAAVAPRLPEEATSDDPSYALQLAALIRPHIVFTVPNGTSPDVYVEFELTLLTNGDIAAIRRLKDSGLPGYDDSVERAIRHAAPFPLKRDISVDRTVIIRLLPIG